MIDLEKVTLTAPLSFVRAADPDDKRNLGIHVRQESRDGKTIRFHGFTSEGVYKGFYDIETKLGTVVGTSEVDPKGSYKKGNTFNVRRYERRLKVGDTKVVLESKLPKIEVDDQGTVRLIRGDKLEPVDLPEVALERIERQAKAEGESPAEVYGERDGSLKNDPSELAASQIEPSESEIPQVDKSDDHSEDYSPEGEDRPPQRF